MMPDEKTIPATEAAWIVRQQDIVHFTLNTASPACTDPSPPVTGVELLHIDFPRDQICVVSDQ